MTTVLITGATGKVGLEVLSALDKLEHQLDVCTGARNLTNDTEKLAKFNSKKIEFDFEVESTMASAFENIDVLFLLRPPQISDVKKWFVPLISIAKQSSIKHIVFLSVQGVGNSKMIPHHKIEKLIVDSEIPYTFLRPAYFMQNFTTTLNKELITNHRIYLPAGNAKFTIINTKDIGAVTANILLAVQKHKNKSYDLTNNEILTFAEMAATISTGIGKPIRYISPNLVQFFMTKRKEKMPIMLILVMIMLHYFPRFQKAPKTSNCVKNITGNEPSSFAKFVNNNSDKLQCQSLLKLKKPNYEG